tara:strand:- start:395 stop:1372 length:978 start_codon:yes stop_codon:yes gene_type:complete
MSCLICVVGIGADIKTVLGESSVIVSGSLATQAPLRGSVALDSNLVPASLLQLSTQFTTVLWVELEHGLLHVLRRQKSTGHWRTILTRPVSIGKAGSGKQLEGDNKTPIGIYSVHDFIGDEKLMDFYGLGAFPLNYPNKWDRLLGRTGSGIWLHGLPKSVRTRPRLDSEGCVVIDNKTLEWMSAYIEPERTRIVLGPKMRWLKVENNQRRRQQLNSRLHDWLAAWSNLDMDGYLEFYHPEFNDGQKDLAEWASYKRRLNRVKSWAKVTAQEVNMFAYPGEGDLVAMEYLQRYNSSNYEHFGRKVLFWRRGINGQWQIVSEHSGQL